MFALFPTGDGAGVHAKPPGRVLSARAHDKILRTARTIADLEEAPDVTATHLADAVQYRRLDRNLFA